MVATDDTNGPFRLRGTSSPNMAFDVANTTPTIFTPVGPQALVANQIALFAGTMDAAQNARVWIDGKPGSATAVTGTPKTLTLGNRLVITTNSAGNVRWGGDLYAAFVWNRALSQGELVSLSQAPFQLFKAPTRKLFYVGATSILPNITSVSTATPRDGATLTITGTDFGASQGAGDVKINGDRKSVV